MPTTIPKTITATIGPNQRTRDLRGLWLERVGGGEFRAKIIFRKAVTGKLADRIGKGTLSTEAKAAAGRVATALRTELNADDNIDIAQADVRRIEIDFGRAVDPDDDQKQIAVIQSARLAVDDSDEVAGTSEITPLSVSPIPEISDDVALLIDAAVALIQADLND